MASNIHRYTQNGLASSTMLITTPFCYRAREIEASLTYPPVKVSHLIRPIVSHPLESTFIDIPGNGYPFHINHPRGPQSCTASKHIHISRGVCEFAYKRNGIQLSGGSVSFEVWPCCDCAVTMGIGYGRVK